MDPITTAAVVGTLTQLSKTGAGLLQNKRANELMENNVRPDYEIPAEIDQIVQMARVLASQNELPGQDIIEEKIGGTLGNQVRDIRDMSSSSAAALSALSRSYGNTVAQQRDLGISAAQNKQRLQELLMERLKMKAQYQDKAWKMNELDPYLETAATASALKQAGLTNIYSGIEGAGRSVSQAALSKGMMETGQESVGPENYMSEDELAKILDREILDLLYPNRQPK
jgi:hypothetical protein